MSTLVAQTISNGTVSTSSANVIQGSAKAWVNFNGVTTTTIRASFNVSSVTRNATGNFTVNFTNALADANYAATMSLAAPDVGNGVVVKSPSVTGTPDLKSTTQLQIIVTNASAVYVDGSQIYVSVFR